MGRKGNELNHTRNSMSKINRAKRAMAVILRSFQKLNNCISIPLYKALVRNRLDSA